MAFGCLKSPIPCWRSGASPCNHAGRYWRYPEVCSLHSHNVLGHAFRSLIGMTALISMMKLMATGYRVPIFPLAFLRLNSEVIRQRVHLQWSCLRPVPTM
jgi:hypothetical protein